MAIYKHGVYGQINTSGTRATDVTIGGMVYVGTAPVHTVEGGAFNVNVPIVVRNIAEAKKYLGYSEDWASYTLCEAMRAHLEVKGVGPLILINVLDPAKHKKSSGGTASKKAENGRIVIPEAESIILDSIAIAGKTKGTDYTVAYNVDKKVIMISETTSGSLGDANLNITYDIIDPSAVTTEELIGETDGMGENTGLHVVKDIYQSTGFIPSYLVAPGFSSVPEVHDAMYEVSQKINGHWDMYMFVDLPLVNEETQIRLDTVAAFKTANRYNHENETVYWPMVQGIDDKNYHLSVLAAANFLQLLLENDGIPYKTVSNTEVSLIRNIYMGEAYGKRYFDDSMVNEFLNKNGIASAAYVGGRWAIWGAHSADYSFEDGDNLNVSETNRMMLYYISNDFQERRVPDVDKSLTSNDLRSIVSEEQTRLDALLRINALTYGEVHMSGEAQLVDDIVNGDYSFVFDVTTTPLAKSLTAIVNWTDEGIRTYFASVSEIDF